MMKTTINEQIVEGIILKRTPYKENDMILHIYTRDYGKIGVLARGVRKMTSKNARATQDLMVSEMTIHLRKGLSTLVRATPVHYLRRIKESIESEIVANYIVEYYYRYVDENAPDILEYQVLERSLEALNQGYYPLLVYLMFNAFILERNGVSIDTDGCVICGSSKVVSISLLDGGFVCANHLGNHPVYDVDVLKAFRHLHKISFDHIDHLHIEESVILKLIPLIDAFVEEYTGISLKTQVFIQQIV